jgi:amino acid adenylation domain-containing protein
MVAQHADRLAVGEGSTRLSYAELDRASNRVAQAMLAQRGPHEEPVVLYLPRGLAAIVGILAALKAGKAYVPVDLAQPSGRTRYLLQDSQAPIVLASSATRGALEGLLPRGVTVLDIDAPAAGVSHEDPKLVIGPDRLSGILYTSGSTGEPKGVMRTHRMVLHGVMRRTRSMRVRPSDRFALLASHSFAASAGQVFGALLTGAAVLPYDVASRGAAGLARWMREEAVTLLGCVPTLLREFAAHVGSGEEFPDLRVLSLYGETVQPGELEFYRRALASGGCLLRLSLGMTEAGGAAWVFLDGATEVEGAVMPAGYPYADVEVLIVDEDGRDVEAGQVGEMLVRSRYLSPGYWRRPDLTENRFIRDPADPTLRLYRTGDLGWRAPDGCLFHVGRKDFQVQVRGQRVELGEIEAALRRLAEVRDCAVVAREAEGVTALTAYVVADSAPAPTVSRLRSRLGQVLPAYMLPGSYVFLDRMPLTPSGKVDRRSLPEPDGSRPELDADYLAPRTPLERAVAQMWSSLLSVSPVGVRDDFFDLGGHSLLAAQLISRVKDSFGVDLRLDDFFATPTPESLTLALIQKLAETEGTEDVEELLDQVEGDSPGLSAS